MRQQDDALGEMEASVSRTRHIAVAINEEVDLHAALLEDLDDETGAVQHRLRAATQRVRQVLRQGSSNWRFGFLVFVAIVAAVFIVAAIVIW